MESLTVTQLGALAHPGRLDLFRLLMRRFPDAVPAGEIAAALGLKPNTASVYLNTLRSAALIDQTRAGKSLLYRADLPRIRGLFDGLLTGCCQNRPDLCLSPDKLSPDKLNPDTLAPDNLTPGPSPTSPRTDAMPAPTKPYSVLFLCTGNSARSIMAEAILNRAAPDRFRAFSAGTEPAGQPHPQVLELLAAKGYATDMLASKSMQAVLPDLPPLDFVFTVCDRAANEPCPVWPGRPMSAHWGLPDPVTAQGNAAQKQLAFQQSYGLLRNRITTFASLPIDTLDRISLQHRLDDIARQTAVPSQDALPGMDAL